MSNHLTCSRHGDIRQTANHAMLQCRECARIAIRHWDEIIAREGTGHTATQHEWFDRLPLWACVLPIVLIVLAAIGLAISSIS